MSRGAFAPLLTEDQIIERVLLLDQRSPAERAFHLRPDSSIRAAIRGELRRDSLTFEERKAAALGRAIHPP